MPVPYAPNGITTLDRLPGLPAVVSWYAEAGVEDYLVDYSFDNMNWNYVLTDETSFSLEVLDSNQDVYFRVASSGSCGNSRTSSTVLSRTIIVDKIGDINLTVFSGDCTSIGVTLTNLESAEYSYTVSAQTALSEWIDISCPMQTYINTATCTFQKNVLTGLLFNLKTGDKINLRVSLGDPDIDAVATTTFT